jgi:hypothetical protein
MARAIVEFDDGKTLGKWMVGLDFLAVSERLLDETKKDKAALFNQTYLVLIAQSTALEAILNDQILLTCLHIYGPDNYQQPARVLLHNSVRDKLILLPPLATGNRYVLNQSSQHVAQLFSIVTKRNKIVHTVVDFEVETDFTISKRTAKLAKVRQADHVVRTLQTSELEENAAALRVLMDDFINRTNNHKFTENRILARNPQYDEWSAEFTQSKEKA